jgi:hypothetical protein
MALRGRAWLCEAVRRSSREGAAKDCRIGGGLCGCSVRSEVDDAWCRESWLSEDSQNGCATVSLRNFL